MCDLTVYDLMQLPHRSADFSRILLSFMKTAIAFGRIEAAAFGRFCNDFVDNGGVALVDFVQRFTSAVVTTTSAWTAKPDSRAFIKDVLTHFFVGKYVLPVDVLLFAFRVRVGKNGDQMLDIAPVTDIISEIITEHPYAFTPNIVLSRRLFSRVTKLEELNEILKALKLCNPLVVTQDIANAMNTVPSIYSRALFSLLPEGLLDENVHIALSYYWHNVTMETVLFWTYWMKKRPYYTQEFPVGLQSYCKEDEKRLATAHREILLDFFRVRYENIHCEGASRFNILARAWDAVCDDKVFAAKAVKYAIRKPQNTNAQFIHVLSDFIHPALARGQRETAEMFCNAICGYPDDNLDDIGRVTAMTCLIYSSLFPRNGRVFVPLGLRMLHLMNRMYTEGSPHTIFVIDCFNCMISKLSSRSEEDISYIFESLRVSYESLPQRLRNLLLILQPPQSFRFAPEKPLYVEDEALPDFSFVAPITDGNGSEYFQFDMFDQ